MKYAGMPMGMWALFAGSFRRELTAVFGYDAAAAKEITKNAKPRYRKIIAGLPEFEKADRFKMNIVNCAMLCAFVLSMPQRPDVQRLTDYYAKSMITAPMRWFCRKSGKNKFSEKDLASMRATAALRAADRNPYSWNMELFEYPDGSGYEARFDRCGICTLMQELGLYDLTSAMCRLDYTMSDAGGASDFVREYTLASGGPYCDCGYRRRSTEQGKIRTALTRFVIGGNAHSACWGVTNLPKTTVTSVRFAGPMWESAPTTEDASTYRFAEKQREVCNTLLHNLSGSTSPIPPPLRNGAAFFRILCLRLQ